MLISYRSRQRGRKDDGQGTKDSPDGVSYNCVFNRDRLQGDAMTRAVIHIGQHVSRFAQPEARRRGRSAFLLENNAWVDHFGSSHLPAGRSSLRCPADICSGMPHWPAAERNDKMEAALKRLPGQRSAAEPLVSTRLRSAEALARYARARYSVAVRHPMRDHARESARFAYPWRLHHQVAKIIAMKRRKNG